MSQANINTNAASGRESAITGWAKFRQAPEPMVESSVDTLSRRFSTDGLHTEDAAGFLSVAELHSNSLPTAGSIILASRRMGPWTGGVIHINVLAQWPVIDLWKVVAVTPTGQTILSFEGSYTITNTVPVVPRQQETVVMAREQLVEYWLAKDAATAAVFLSNLTKPTLPVPTGTSQTVTSMTANHNVVQSNTPAAGGAGGGQEGGSRAPNPQDGGFSTRNPTTSIGDNPQPALDLAAVMQHMEHESGKQLAALEKALHARLEKIIASIKDTMGDGCTDSGDHGAGTNPDGKPNRRREDVTQEFNITTLDGVIVVMNTRSGAHDRLKLVQGYHRLVENEQFQYLVRDGVFRERQHYQLLTQAIIDSSHDGSAPGFERMDLLPTICDLPIFRDAVTAMNFACWTHWFQLDYSGFHLRWFLLPNEIMPLWDTTVSRSGKQLLAAAIHRLEVCMVVMHHKTFLGCMSRLQEITHAKYGNYSDGYIRHYLEEMLAYFAEEVTGSQKPTRKGYRHMPMKTPHDCAQLMQQYVGDFMDRLTPGWQSTETHLSPFTQHPHSLFFSEQGPYHNVLHQDSCTSVTPVSSSRTTGAVMSPLTPTTVRVVTPPSTVPLKRKIGETEETPVHCMWAMAGVVGVRSLSTQEVYHCRVNNCPSRHEAKDIGDVARLLTEADFRVWKTSPKVKLAMADAIPNFDKTWM